MDDQRQSEVAEEMPPSYLPEKLDEDPKSASDDAAESEDAGDADDDRKLDADDDREAEKGKTQIRHSRAPGDALHRRRALLVSVIVKTFFMQAFYVPSGSMENTLRPKRPHRGQQNGGHRRRDSQGETSSSSSTPGTGFLPASINPRLGGAH